MLSFGTKIHLGDKTITNSTKEEIATAMDPELAAFDHWFRAQGNEPLTRMERSILKTYLAWKMIYEQEGDVDTPA